MRSFKILVVAALLAASPAYGKPGARRAAVSVDAGRVVRTVDPRVFGINAAIWDATLADGTAAPALEPLALNLFRFPGGSLSDEYHWKTNMTDGEDFRWASDFDAFMRVVGRVGGQAMITANYGSGTAEEAAEWVRYANVEHAFGVHYWEIGNECYGGWEHDTHAAPNDPYTYATEAASYIAAMKAVDPTIEIGVVALTGEDSSFVRYTDHPARNPRTGVSHTGWTPVMLARLAELGATPDFVVFHWYAQNPGPESDALLLQSTSTWRGFAADLRGQVTDYLGAAGAGVELLVTENNSVSFDPGKQTTSLVNGLYLADSVGQLLQTEFDALVWWDLSNGQLTGNNNSKSLYGWRKYGDYGILSPDHAARYPTYRAMELLTHFARGGERVVETASDADLLACYAVVRSDGGLALLVVNKSPSTAFAATFAVEGFEAGAEGTAFSYGKKEDKAAKTGRGSPEVSRKTFEIAGGALAYTFAPYSMTVLTVPAAAAKRN